MAAKELQERERQKEGQSNLFNVCCCVQAVIKRICHGVEQAIWMIKATALQMDLETREGFQTDEIEENAPA